MKTSAFLLLLTSASIALGQTPTQPPVPTPPTPAPAPSGPAIKISAQVRERSEFDGRSFTPGTSVDVLHYLRSRLGVTGTIDTTLSATIEVQDARIFGQKGTTLNNGAPSLDVRQAFVEVKNIAGMPLGVRVGRQAIAYANERLIGRIEWSNFAQSFDGVVATIGSGDVSVDLMGLAVARNANTPRYNRDVFLTGAWGGWRGKDPALGVQAFFLFDNPRQDSVTRQNRFTTGLFSNGAIEGFDYEIDGAYQFGDHIRSGAMAHTHNIAASLIGARAGYTLKEVANLRIGVGYDRLSGTDPGDTDTYGAFHTLYATNHKFYGFMDYFTNIPAHTRGLGLQDIMVNLSVAPAKEWKLAADVHLFSTAVDPADLPAPPTNATTAIGKELDLTITYAPTRSLSLTCGWSVFDGDPDRPVIIGTRKTTQWGYASLMVGF